MRWLQAVWRYGHAIAGVVAGVVVLALGAWVIATEGPTRSGPVYDGLVIVTLALAAAGAVYAAQKLVNWLYRVGIPRGGREVGYTR